MREAQLHFRVDSMKWSLQMVCWASAGLKGPALLYLIRVLQGVACFKVCAAAKALGV